MNMKKIMLKIFESVYIFLIIHNRLNTEYTAKKLFKYIQFNIYI